MTGFSGRHTEMPRDAMFGEPVGAHQPIIGDRITSEEAAMPDFASDPLLMANRAEMIRAPAVRCAGAGSRCPGAPRLPPLLVLGHPRSHRPRQARRLRTGHRTRYRTAVVQGHRPGRRQGRSSYLMETPLRWYQADMARNAEELDNRLRDIREGQAGPGAGDNRYIPQQGIRITRGA